VIELHLIGYTEDGDHLVFDLEAGGEGRYVVAVEPDLLATLEAARRERIARGQPVDVREGPWSEAVPAPPGRVDTSTVTRPTASENGRTPGMSAPSPAPRRGSRPARDSARSSRASSSSTTASESASSSTPARSPDPDGSGTLDDAPSPPAPRTDPASAEAIDGAGPAVTEPSDAAAASRSGLSPAEIQARLRAGRSVRAVAREAGADAAWVERWHTPIVAERERVLADARSRRVDRPRARPLGAAVDRSLLDRGIPPQDAVWRVVRRDDGRWRVSVRFEEDGRTRTATWLLDPNAERLRAQSPLATELSAPGGSAARR
jgi:hypothetical protein